jgi:hypothetical protein
MDIFKEEFDMFTKLLLYNSKLIYKNQVKRFEYLSFFC